MKTYTPTYALGMFGMLYDALRQHARLHYGAKPHRFVLHPALVCELLVTITPSQRAYIDMDAKGNYRFMGVPIESDMRADRAKLVNVKNVIIYL